MAPNQKTKFLKTVKVARDRVPGPHDGFPKRKATHSCGKLCVTSIGCHSDMMHGFYLRSGQLVNGKLVSVLSVSNFWCICCSYRFW